MTVTASQHPGVAGAVEPDQLRHERDTLGLVPLYVAGGPHVGRAVIAVHRDAAHAVWKHAYADYHTVTFHVAGAPLYRRRTQHDAAEVAAAGSVTVQSCGEESLWDGDAPSNWVQFYLSVGAVADLATQTLDVDGGRVTLERATGLTHPRLSRFAYAAWLAHRQFAQPAPEDIDAWSYAIADWLLRSHSSVRQRFPALRRERMRPAKFRAVCEFIEEHLTASITIADLARASSMSDFHFIRAFTAAAGRPPHQYIIDQRVQRACRSLEGTDSPIAAVAHETGFSSQAHMTSTFKRIIGISPACYRNLTAAPRARGSACRRTHE